MGKNNPTGRFIVLKYRDIGVILLLFITTNLEEIKAMETQEITTKTGKVQGVVEPSRIMGKKVQKFSNIPYAEPPVGNLRFAKPQPRKPWNGTLKNSRPAVCWQQGSPNDTFTEDCLILNIWTPFPQPQNTTVMIWMHGGSFTLGSSGTYLGHNFVSVGNVILVTINYRLSVLGFLSTGDHRIKGNFALFDQRLAMKWVKENIASFGGNPQSITIFGVSAGGACVSAHTVSKNSWPYFDRAIIQSGLITAYWATATKDSAKRMLRLFLQNVNCADNEHLLECLRSSINVTFLERFYFSKPFPLNGMLLPPIVDGDFLIDEPKKLWTDGEVKKADTILGMTKEESFFMEEALIETSRNISFLTKKFHEKLETTLTRKLNGYNTAVYNQALKLYQPKCIPSFREAFKPTMAFLSDLYFVCDTVEEANLRSKILNSTNTYLYQYSYSSPLPSRWYPKGTYGFAAHALDVVSTFGMPIEDHKYPAEDQILSIRIILYWTNFAKNGDPNLGITKFPFPVNKVTSLPKWPKFTDFKREYIDMESLSRIIIKTRLRETYCDFWKDPVRFTKQATRSVAVKHIAQEVSSLLVLAILLPFYNLIFGYN